MDSMVEMRVARLRALTQFFDILPELSRGVEMRVARLRALTQSFVSPIRASAWK